MAKLLCIIFLAAIVLQASAFSIRSLYPTNWLPRIGVLCNTCHLQPVTGPCKANHTRYYYDVLKRLCEEFTYGGCNGNRNNFETKQECEKACRKRYKE